MKLAQLPLAISFLALFFNPLNAQDFNTIKKTNNLAVKKIKTTELISTEDTSKKATNFAIKKIKTTELISTEDTKPYTVKLINTKSQNYIYKPLYGVTLPIKNPNAEADLENITNHLNALLLHYEDNPSNELNYYFDIHDITKLSCAYDIDNGIAEQIINEINKLDALFLKPELTDEDIDTAYKCFDIINELDKAHIKKIPIQETRIVNFKKIHLNIVDTQNQSINNAQAYLISPNTYKLNKQTNCKYDYSQCNLDVIMNKGQNISEDNKILPNVGYHVFVVKDFDGISEIIQYKKLPIQGENFTIVVE